MRTCAFFVTLAACLLSSQARLGACSCAGGIPPCRAAWQAGAIFVGKVMAIDDLPGVPTPSAPDATHYRRRVSLHVSEVFRGEVGDSATVFTGMGGGDCGYSFSRGSTYLIYAHRAVTGQLTTGICSRTGLLNALGDDLKYLRAALSRPDGTGTVKGIAKRPDPHERYASFNSAAPYAGGLITLEPVDAGRTDRYETKTDANGRYSIRVPAGDYKVELNVRDGLYALAGFTRADVKNVRGCAEVNFTVRPDGRVGGRVIDADGRPVPRVTVEIVPAASVNDSIRVPASQATTDDAGVFEFNHLSPGGYAVGLTLFRESTAPTTSAIWLTELRNTEPKHTSIEPEARTSAGDFVLPASAKLSTIRGTVTLSDNGPAKGAKVYVLTFPYLSVAAGPAEADSNGAFSFTLVAGRSYKISAGLPGAPASPPKWRKAESEPFTPAQPELPPFRLLIR